MINGILAPSRKGRHRIHFDVSRLNGGDAAQMHPCGLLRCTCVSDAVFERTASLSTSALVGVVGDVADAVCEAAGVAAGRHRLGDHDVHPEQKKKPRTDDRIGTWFYTRIIMRAYIEYVLLAQVYHQRNFPAILLMPTYVATRCFG